MLDIKDNRQLEFKQYENFENLVENVGRYELKHKSCQSFKLSFEHVTDCDLSNSKAINWMACLIFDVPEGHQTT